MTQKQIAEQIKGDVIMLGKDVAVLTEDFEDQIFWRDVIKTANPNLKTYFPNQLLKGAGGTGTLNKYRPFIDDRLIVCFDSDNRFIWSKEDLPFSKPFIYETYVYSIENYRFHPEAINEFLHKVTLVEVDMSDFMASYSESIADVFLLLVYSKSNNIESIYEMLNEDNLKNILALDLTLFESWDDLDALLNELSHRINAHLQSIAESITKEWYESIFETEIPELKAILSEKFGIEQAEYVFFIKGHLIEDFIFTDFVKALITILKSKKKEELKEVAEKTKAKKEEAENRLRHYENLTSKDITTLIKESHGFHLKFPTKFFQKIIVAIKRDFPTTR